MPRVERASADAWRRGGGRADQGRTTECLAGPAVERAADDLQALRTASSSRANRAAGSSTPACPSSPGSSGATRSPRAGSRRCSGPRPARRARGRCRDPGDRRMTPGATPSRARCIHELRRGPLAMLGLSPRDAYYGSQTTPAMFVIALSELWHWTGDDALLRRFRDAALRAIEWAETRRPRRRRLPRVRAAVTGAGSGTRAGRTRTRRSATPTAGSPSPDRDRRGAGVPLPRPAAHGRDPRRARRADDARRASTSTRAAELRERWHEAFWMPR